MDVLDTLPPGEWVRLARRVRAGIEDGWEYLVGTHEAVAEAREAGRLVTMLRRTAEGFELMGWRRG